MDSKRRQRGLESAQWQSALRFGSLELHPGRQLLRDGVALPLGGIALELLGALVRARGRLVTKDELFAAAWPGLVVVENALHQHMRSLRVALGDDADQLITVARRGYRFIGHVEELSLEPLGTDAMGAPPALPMPLTPLIGRDDQLPAIEGLLALHRCLSLLGPGGVGKTRLAQEIARRRADGGGLVLWVELAAVGDGEGVAGAVASACGLIGPSGVPPLERVIQVLRRTTVLVVLDNCEHLVEACAAAAHDLLQSCSGLQLLVTSQRPVGVAGEHRWQVPMLGLPPLGTTDPAAMAVAPAVRLLLERVADCGSPLRGGGHAMLDAVELCRQLDGNALAIELAAPRVAAIGLTATKAALRDHLHLLADGPRDVQLKHRSLHAMIDWSHALLSQEQAAVWRRLAVFHGGWTVESGLAVAGAGAGVDSNGIDIARSLAELVERCLIVSEGSAGETRFRMLEVQRLYALEKLRVSGEAERYEASHARHIAALFEAGYLAWDSTADQQWLAIHGPERDNLRKAIRCALANSDADLAARLIGSSIWLWRASGAMHELRQLLTHPLLGEAMARPGAQVARLMLARAYCLHSTSSESSDVKAAATAAVAAFEGSDDVVGAANSLLCLASAFVQLGDIAAHQSCAGRVEALLHGRHRQGKTYAWFCGSQAWAAQLAGDVRAALGWATKSCAAYRGSGGWHGETRAMLHMADLRLAAGDTVQAIAMGQECVARLQGGQHRADLGRAMANLGAAWFACGDLEHASACWANALEALRGLDFSYWVFDHIALLAIAEGRADAAAQMIGYADAGYARLRKGQRVQNEQRAFDRAMAHLRARYAQDELDELMSIGVDASEDDMASLALRLATVDAD